MRVRTLLIRLLFLAFCGLLVAIVVAANRDALPRWLRVIYYLPAGDKVGHFFLMGLLALGLNAVLQLATVPIFSRHVLLGSLIVLVVVTLEELSQYFITTRTLSLADLLADYAGIWTFGQLSKRLFRRSDADE
jgi:VanZ family protein